MPNINDKKENGNLSNEEMLELRQAQELYEMDKENPGWQIVKQWLEDMAIHTWIDPREIENSPDAHKEWEWRELNAFHAANNAKELLERIAQMVSRGEYLDKVKSGEIKRNRMKV